MMAQKLGVPIDLVVKFGGSAITDKHQLESLRKDNLVSAAATISHCVDHGLRCVVVHGAGSFGHHHAKDYEVNSGLHGTAEEVKRRKYGMCLTRLSVTKLNHEVVRSLVDVKVNAIGMSAIGVWVADNGEIFRHGVNGILELLDNGFVPVLHGDCVLDASKGCGILSGDVIIKTLCKEHLVNRVVFLSDVTGVFDKPPSETGNGEPSFVSVFLLLDPYSSTLSRCKTHSKNLCGWKWENNVSHLNIV
ncbi:uncharacterized protein [Argopecten irradians]|uniref:uncharacterized protein isoform X2 n=1 Tax=Argopecten irradians TaxID=31199 RepID=UPI003711A9E5